MREYHNLGMQFAAVQINVFVELSLLCMSGEAVEMEEYEGSAAGLIQSFIQRFTEDNEEVEAQLLQLSSKDSTYWCC